MSTTQFFGLLTGVTKPLHRRLNPELIQLGKTITTSLRTEQRTRARFGIYGFQAIFTDALGSRDAARAATKASTAATPSNVALNSKVAR